jgi:hypothetical protein
VLVMEFIKTAIELITVCRLGMARLRAADGRHCLHMWSVAALGYGLDEQGSRVRFPAGAGNFSLYHRVHNGSGAHPASYPMGTKGSFPGGKVAGA